MGRVAVLVLLVACAKHHDSPPSPLQDGAAVAIADAAPVVTIDAPAATAPEAKKVVVNDRVACAVMSDGSVRCWGDNGNAQLGDGTFTSATTPVVAIARGARDLVIDDDLVCALIDDTSVACWGKIGYGKTDALMTPQAVPGVRDIARVFAVGGAACGTERSGALICWGKIDPRGHVSDGKTHAPTPMPGIDHVVALTEHAAVKEDGEVWMWLDGGAPKATPVAHATELAELNGTVCALADGEVTCFGDTARCGAPIAPPAPPPPKPKAKTKPKKPLKANVAVVVPTGPIAFALPTGKTAHLAFDKGVCAVTTAKRLDCIDFAQKCKVTRPWPAFVSVEQTSGWCARLTNGTVRCGTEGSPAAPVIAGVTNAVSISAAKSHGCALTKDHAVWCWDSAGTAKQIAF